MRNTVRYKYGIHKSHTDIIVEPDVAYIGVQKGMSLQTSDDFLKVKKLDGNVANQTSVPQYVED